MIVFSPGCVALDSLTQTCYTHRSMSLWSLSFAHLFALAAFALPSVAAPNVKLEAIPAGQEERYALDGIIFKNYPYTILFARATSYRDSEEGVYDHTVFLRFHNDKSRRVDIKVLAPGETFDGKSYDDWVSYTSDLEKGDLIYTLVEKGAHELDLHVQRIYSPHLSRKVAPNCDVKLRDSSYTYILGGGNKLFIYELAEDAMIWASWNDASQR